MGVCVGVRVFVCKRVYVCLCACVYVCVCVHACMCVFVRKRVSLNLNILESLTLSQNSYCYETQDMCIVARVLCEFSTCYEPHKDGHLSDIR